MNRYYFTSESVTDGHPDKICDQIADAILDEALSLNPHAKMAVEATIKDDVVIIYGEQNLGKDFKGHSIDVAKIARRVIADIGYTEHFKVINLIGAQSQDIYDKVKEGKDVMAGDQGIMFGYATNETDNYMPLAIEVAHRLSQRLSELKKEDTRIRPDGKTQVTVLYEDDKPIAITHVVISTMHTQDITQDELYALIKSKVIDPVIDSKWIQDDFKIDINPGGQFIIGGPFGDSGTTGRKIVVDTYGGMGRIGGGCFSSKDPSKVDRSAAYYCRYVAKNLVAHGLMDRCEIQVSYAIGLAKPLSIYINSFNTHHKEMKEIYEIVDRNFDFSVSNIISELDLLKPIYRKTANFGHFGKEGLSWEVIKTLK